MSMEDMKKLATAIRQLKTAAEEVARLSAGLPAAEKNSYMIMKQIEMLEIEICDPVDALSCDPTTESNDELR
jgi:hypothetical protein